MAQVIKNPANMPRANVVALAEGGEGYDDLDTRDTVTLLYTYYKPASMSRAPGAAAKRVIREVTAAATGGAGHFAPDIYVMMRELYLLVLAGDLSEDDPFFLLSRITCDAMDGHTDADRLLAEFSTPRDMEDLIKGKHANTLPPDCVADWQSMLARFDRRLALARSLAEHKVIKSGSIALSVPAALLLLQLDVIKAVFPIGEELGEMTLEAPEHVPDTCALQQDLRTPVTLGL